MKISVDAGALCSKTSEQFGTYTFAANLLRALINKDHLNDYFIYSFCQKQKDFRFPPNFHYRQLLPSNFWMSGRVSLEELIAPKDLFLALNQAIPLATKAKIIAFSHGLSFIYYPELYLNSCDRLKKQLDSMIKKAEWIIVSSKKIKDEFQELYPQFVNKVIVITFGLPYLFYDYKEQKREDYFLYVGMNAPIKNIDFLIRCFKRFKANKNFSNYKLHIVNDLSGEKLRDLYRKAKCYLTASFYESFNFPVIEALSQNCPVVGLESAIIPELKPYVELAESEEQFVEKMKEAATGKTKNINRDEIKKRFSWDEYINVLLSTCSF